jgi:hypothetical protein
MPQFTDLKGQAWNIEITIAAAKRLRNQMDIDVLAITGDNREEVIERLADPITMFDVLFVTVEPQAKELGIGDEEFGLRVGMELIEKASILWWESLVNFSPPTRREALRTIVNAGRRVGQAMDRKMASIVESGEFAREIDKAADQVIARLEGLSSPGPKSIDSPESSGSPTVTA